MEKDPIQSEEDFRDEIRNELDRRAQHYNAAMTKLADEVRTAIQSLKQDHSRLLFTQGMTVMLCATMLLVIFIMAARIVLSVVGVLHAL